MPDIAMCLSTDCPSRERCYRNEASGTKPSKFRQAYISTPNWRDWNGYNCGVLWPVRPNKE